MNIKTLLEYVPDLKRDNRGLLVGTCPLCGGAYHSFALFFDDDATVGHEYGYNCRECKASGSAIDLLVKLGIPFSKACYKLGYDKRAVLAKQRSTAKDSGFDAVEALPENNVLNQYKWAEKASALLEIAIKGLSDNRAKAFFADRGIECEGLEKIGTIGFLPKSQKYERSEWGLNLNGGRMYIPSGFLWAITRASGIVGVCVRLEDRNIEWYADNHEGKKLNRFKVVPGSRKLPFFIGDKNTPLCVMESVLDAILLYQASNRKISCVAMQGIDATFDEEAQRHIESSSKVLFIPDNDEAGRNALKRWKDAIPSGIELELHKGLKDIGSMGRIYGADTVRRWLYNKVKPVS